ncbi:MAG: DUF4434 domain-containing protein, partial [Clostridia bacterium]|nr:DUF4434 domain-containing protein [Clostridia bacterium]
VRVLNPDGTIHTAAYISAGFTNYSDNGGVRTWTLSKRVPVTFNGHKRAIASGEALDDTYTKASKAPYTDQLIVVVHQGDEPDEYIPAEQPVIEREHGLIAGSFLQGWLCRDWTQERWNAEFAGMKEVGMDHIIIQSVYDWALAVGGDKQNWQTYSTNSKYSLYPTQISAISGANCSSDQIERMLIAAKEYDMQVYLGLMNDSRWFQYGWEALTAPSGSSTTYFESWCQFNADIQADMIEEIWNRYGDEYGDQIAGWYYYNEIWNINATIPAQSLETYTRAVADGMNVMIDAINENCPSKPLMISPFFNPDYGTAQAYGEWWEDMYTRVDFRAGDIMAPQDTVGSYGESSIPLRIGQWIAALADAAQTEQGLVFWVNNETFTSGYGSEPVSILIKQIEASDAYTDVHILFSWNHYYNPAQNSSFQSYHNQLVDYVNSRSEAE